MLDRASLGVVVSIGALSFPGCDFDRARRVESFTVEDDVSALTVDLGAGDVRVHGSAGPTTSVTAWIHGEHCALDRDYRSGRLTLASRLEKPAGLRRHCEIELDISVPQDVDLSLSTGSGNVDAFRINGAVDVDTGSGNIELGELSGDLTLETGSGNIEAREIASPSAYAHSGSGNVSATFTVAPNAVSVDTGSGNVHLRLPAERYRLDTDRGSGDVRITGIVNDPDADRWIAIDTGSGNIEITGL